MKKTLIQCFLLSIILGLSMSQNILQFQVDPFIGSGGEGYGIGSNNPGAQTPYGAVRLGPDTSNILKIWAVYHYYGGYYYRDTFINMFSHSHMVGAGVADYGWVGVMPISVDQNTNLASQLQVMLSTQYGWRSKFSHQMEQAHPGYYQVYLHTHRVNVELSASEHVGAHQYQWDYPDRDLRVVIFHASYTLNPGACDEASVTVSGQSVTGFVHANGRLSERIGGVKTYFVANITNTVVSFGTFDDSGVHPLGVTANGCKAGAYVVFSSEKGPVQFKVGISYISLVQAQLNLDYEVGNSDFYHIQTATEKKWFDELNRFEIQTNDNKEYIQYYTSVYHSMCSPTLWSQAGGFYLGFDNQLKQQPSTMGAVYTDFSIWDTHRTQSPWILLHDPPRMADIIGSFMLIYEQGGYLPKWQIANGPTGQMFGSHAAATLGDFIVQNQYTTQGLNITQAVEALLKLANTNLPHESRYNPKQYIRLGYKPVEDGTNSAPETLAYSFDDWCISNVMTHVGQIDEANDFKNRSKFYKNVWDSQSQFFCARSQVSNQLVCPSVLARTYVWDKYYVEGDAWHYRFYVPGDPEGLIDLFGGNQTFTVALQQFFDRSHYYRFNPLPNPWYWSGNEHDLFSVWLFAYAGRPDLTHRYQRYILKNDFNTKDNGIPGNDDYGTMSSWFAFASTGLYPRVGSPQYIISSPVIDSIKIKRKTKTGGFCTLTINTHDNSEANYQIDHVNLNGKPLVSYPFLDHNTDLACSQDGGEVVLDYFMRKPIIN